MSRTIMRERCVSHVSAIDLSTIASARALACAGLDPSDVNLSICGGVSNDELVPNSASGVQIAAAVKPPFLPEPALGELRLSRVGENTSELKAWNTLKVAYVAGDNLQPMMKSGRGDLKIGIVESRPGALEHRANGTEDLGGGSVEREDGHCGKNAALDVHQMSITGLRAVGALIEFSNRDGADILVLATHGANPLHEQGCRFGAE